MVTKEDVINELLTGLTETCLYYQTRGCRNPYLIEEMRSYLWEVILTTPEKKIVEVYERKKCNAWITQIIKRSFWSKNSPFYKIYRKHQANEVDLEEARNVLAEDIE